MNNKEQLLKVASYIQKLNTDIYSKYLLLENKLFEWFKESRSQLKFVSHYIVQTRVHSLAKKEMYQLEYSNIKDVKFS